MLNFSERSQNYRLTAAGYSDAFLTRAFTHLCNVIPDFTDNNLINIIRYGQDYYASSEVNYINQINPDTLETVGRVSASASKTTAESRANTQR